MVSSLLATGVPAQSIFTVAGGGTTDGRPATVVQLDSHASGVVVDAQGNLFIAETYQHRIRRVDASTGIITTVAGNGSYGFSGDGGQSTSAALAYPSDVALDQAGNLFIADTNNGRIRRVDAESGIITTVAGNHSFCDDDGPATRACFDPWDIDVDANGHLYIADSGGQRIRRVDASTGFISTVAGTGVSGFSGDGGPATAATLSFPRAIVRGASGNLFIGERGNNRVRRVDAETGVITTLAGNGSTAGSGDGGPATAAGFSVEQGLAVGVDQDLLLADPLNRRVRRIDLVTGIITTIAGGGNVYPGDGAAATEVQLASPADVAVDSSGNLFVGESGRIRRVTATNGLITTVAGGGSLLLGDGGPATAAILSLETARGTIAVDASGNLLIADLGHRRIRRVDEAGSISTIAGGGSTAADGVPATSAALSLPAGVAVDSKGDLYIADATRVRKVDKKTGLISTIAGGGSSSPGDGGPATAANLKQAQAVGIDASGNLFIADALDHRVRRVDVDSGIITTVAGDGTQGFSGDGGPGSSASLNNPYGIALDSGGNLFIADFYNYRVRRVDAVSNVITTAAGGGTRFGDGGPATEARLNGPRDVTLDESGDLYIADSGNFRIRRVDARSGTITTFAGSGASGNSGDGGSATSAGIAAPHAVTLDSRGSLFVATRERVRAIFACVPIVAPPLASPANHSRGVDRAPRLDWERVEGVFRYDVYLDQSNPPGTLLAAEIESTAFAPTNLEPSTRYYWMVVAKGDRFCEPFSTAKSEVRSFTTASECTAPAAEVSSKSVVELSRESCECRER